MWKNRFKPYDTLSGEDVEAIHEQAMLILEEIGVDFYRPSITSTENVDRWNGLGAKTAEVVAAPRRKKVLEEYPAPGIDPGVDEQLRELIAQRKLEIDYD